MIEQHPAYGLAADGIRYVIAHIPPVCELCGNEIQVGGQRDKRFIETGWCDSCCTPDRLKIFLKEKAMNDAWLMDNAFRRHLAQQAEAKRKWSLREKASFRFMNLKRFVYLKLTGKHLGLVK